MKSSWRIGLWRRGALAVLIPLLGGAAPAGAATPDLLLRIPKSTTDPGPAAGQLDNPRHLAANPVNGRLYISEHSDKRISEFTAWGEFVRAWGWGVVASGPGNEPQNEIQEVTVDATGGSFALRFFRTLASSPCSREQVTAPIAFNAFAATVQEALEGICDLAPGDVTVGGSAGGPWRIEFTGSHADTDILPLKAVNSTLTGGTASASVKTLQGGANFEICVPADGDVCRAGQGSEFGEGGGASPGQFTAPRGVAVDSSGDVYVFDSRGEGEKNARVQKFSPSGEFLLMFGGEVNKTTKANVCTKASGDECGIGVLGTGKGQFNSTEVGNYIAAGPGGTIFVGDKGRVQEFNPDGTFKEEINLEGELGGKTVKALDVDAEGKLYVALSGQANVFKLGASGEILHTYAVKNPIALALDATGNLYVVAAEKEVIGFDPAGNPIAGMEAGKQFARAECDVFPAFCGEFSDRPDLNGVASNICTGSEEPGNLYAVRFRSGSPGEARSYVSVYGTPPIGCEPPPLEPPDIVSQSVLSVDTDGALVKARINPRFWADTTYYVQYGTGECSKGGCDKAQPLAPGAKLTDNVIDAPLNTEGVFVGELEPGTTYHYRFAAQSGGGGPVFGVGGKVGEDGAEGTFRTFSIDERPDSCPNRAFRSGPAAHLPDCRAYEMVSPLEKNNGDIVAGASFTNNNTSLYQSADSGEKLTYSSYRSFGDTDAAPYTSQYLAERDPGGGWSSESISPPRTRQVLGSAGTLQNEFRIFSPELCTAWLRHDSEPTLAPGAVEGYANLYRADLCGGEGYEALTLSEPPIQPPEEYFPLEAQGVSADGAHAIYVANDKLTEDAPTIVGRLLYEHTGGQMRFVCKLPSGEASEQACTAGSGIDIFGTGHKANVHNAISADGSRIFWTAYSDQSGLGQLYVRIGGVETVAVSEAAEALSGTKASRFWSAAADGSKAIFTSGKDLYEFEVGEEQTTPIADAVEGVMGTSNDASRVYFVSTDALDEGAVIGEPNLYLHEEGVGTSFVMALSPTDLKAEHHSPIDPTPLFRPSRVSADGRHAVFMSNVSPAPTGYDNTDVASGEPATEVYLYDADAGELRCVSCNPSWAQPAGKSSGGSRIAARIPPWERSLYASSVLSANGDRLFFESYEALVAGDANGVLDVYQWEAEGTGSCEEGDASFAPDSGGCVDLISSGESPRDSIFLDAGPAGDDVFIATLSSLLPQDYGLVDVYDARVEGGFPAPVIPKAPCEGEACQSPSTPPNDPTPASSGFSDPGSGKVKNGSRPRRCAKRKRRAQRAGKKPRCQKKRKQQRHQGRAGR